jgi:ribosomal-protein-alanine N-acetyltransferase
MSPSRSTVLITDRVVLRPSDRADAIRAFEIQSNWNVTRMLRKAAFPSDRAEIDHWFADHEREWLTGQAYRFALVRDQRFVGLVDLDEIAEEAADLGYWLDEAVWGQGFAYEAATAVVRFAFETARLSKLRSGHALDNPASGRVLHKLGFRQIDEVQLYSRPRASEIVQRRYELMRSDRHVGGGD